MSPLIPHRRSRRRSRSNRVIVLVCALIVTGLLVGGVVRVASRSGAYDASMDLSFATQAAVVVADSNHTASSVRHLMVAMEGLDRPTLQADLDGIADQAGQQAASAAALGAPASPGDLQRQFAAVFAARAEAVSQLRTAIDGLLGLHPLGVAGAPEEDHGATNPRLLSSTDATDQIAAAGALLARSDRSYRSLGRSLSRAAGHARLPSSQWVTSAALWRIGSVATQVDVLVSSRSLAVTHRLVLTAVQISPPALPAPTGVASPTISSLSPTHTVVLTVVLSNLGSVDEPHASVQFTLAPLPAAGTTGAAPGATVTVVRRAPVGFGASVTLSPASFAVKPGDDYELTVAVQDLSDQTDLTGTELADELQIAPGT